MDTRYQVFVSSTFRDLQSERREVMHALLEMNCFPAGMEIFPASDDDAWTLIKSVIDQSDYYALIIGGRYGSTTKDGVSFTEKEYDYAWTQKKPVIAFLHGDPGKLPMESSELDTNARSRLQKFRAKIEERHTCKYWSTAEDLGGKVTRALNLVIKSHKAIGWVRADVASPELLHRLEEARTRIEGLEAELSNSADVPPNTEHLAQADDVVLISGVVQNERKVVKRSAEAWFTWDEMVSSVGPRLKVEQSEVAFRNSVSRALTAAMRENGGLKPGEKVVVNDQSFYKVKYQLLSLGIVGEYQRSEWRNAPDYGLTPYGRKYLYSLFAERRGHDKAHEATTSKAL